MKTYDLVIIGGGPAGIFAASVAHIKGLKPLLIEANDYLGGQPLMVYSQKIVEDYPGYTSIKAYQLIDNLINQLKHTKVPVCLKTKVIKCIKNRNDFQLTLCNKEVINTKAVVIATGPGMFTPNRLDIKGATQNNVQYNVCDLSTYKNKHLVILGGGDSAVDWANELSKVAKSVTLVHRRDEFRANGSNVNALKKNAVKIYLDSLPQEIKKNQLVITNNTTNKNTILSFDYLIVQYGQSIDTSGLNIFNQLKLNEQKRIPVNASQMTNIDGIYAVGNICIYDGKPSSIICAHGEAAVAIRHILNTLRPYDKKIISK
ncbi:MAG: NAD(P)/FAD-dependent oxidoreductase [Mycoplasmataceae bacterium]|jgi:thioredoxin reductase (NADPH)|nr:NAD(P)/FAD-dependent oxidoreductase [Mycoplasmataceae bacterium]